MDYKGPWIVLDLRGGAVPEETISIANSDYGIVCRIKNEIKQTPLEDEDLENARLIAAAPRMLQELKEILAWAKEEGAPLRAQEIYSIEKVISLAEHKD